MNTFSFEACRHIVVEGPIGVGKSSLARRLARHLRAELMMEKPEENPFLARFYADGSRYAFQTQMFFLFQRLEQYRELAQPGMFAGPVVSDFLFAKDALFAQLTLSDDEYALYAQMYAHLAPQIPQPDLVIWLQAEPATLLQRIARRGIPMEQGIDADYLQRLSDAYFEHFKVEQGAPLFAIDTEGFNPIDREADFDRLIETLKGFDGTRAFFSPRMMQVA
ncbi:deoxynucleoside kinase [Aquabacterium sp. A7-Y]|uniref:deoxynucleoside kinase n=1 Tax=Aquabacterium sp. A7-Y TaxID=1349605 RepID=UPI00223E2D27|nr:deoxynucleoside kinase [Aquabacterium sp. A7-Y]MCW7536466.1 deoxynucleoside kinase [Aquabacterium sp. A7-Y]